MKPSGGIERVIATLSAKLSSNYEVTILVKDEPVSFYPIDERVKLASVNNELKFDMANRLSRIFTAIKTIVANRNSIRKYIKSNDFDYYYLAHPLNVLEFVLAGADQKKMVVAEHGARSAYNKVYRLIKKMIYPGIYKYVVPTITDTALYKQEGFPATYIQHFRSTLPYKNANRQQNIVLNIGRFTPDKQQITLLKIWKKLLQNGDISNWMLHLVGEGELESELKDYIAVHNLGDHVKMLPPIKNVEQYYTNASIFVLTSRSEGFGMVLLEAISFGLPCVAFDCPSGPRDIIKSDENGYLIDLNNTLTFEQKLKTLINEQNLRDLLGNQAYNDSANWTDQVVSEKWYNVFS